MKYLACNFKEYELKNILKRQKPLGWAPIEYKELIKILGQRGYYDSNALWYIECDGVQDNPKLVKLYEK